MLLSSSPALLSSSWFVAECNLRLRSTALHMKEQTVLKVMPPSAIANLDVTSLLGSPGFSGVVCANVQGWSRKVLGLSIARNQQHPKET